MKLRLLLPCLIALFISCKPVDTPTIPVSVEPRPFPTDHIISLFEAYTRSDGALSPTRCSIDSIQEIQDSILRLCFPELRFYTVTIRDPSAIGYNFGKIKCVATVPNTGYDFRLLLPNDFLDNQSDFVSLFYDRSFGNKDAICKSINHLFVSIIPMHSYNCEKGMKNLQEKAISYGDTVMIMTSFKKDCTELINHQTFESFEHYTLLFSFFENAIRRIGPFKTAL